MFILVSNNNNHQTDNLKILTMTKSVSYILITINLIFAFIMHTLLAFFSTDG